MSDSGYVCTLSAEALKKAEKEIFEKESDRLSSVQALRNWIQEQPHLNFPSDTATLLRLLRGAKFSQLRARELINNQLTLKNECPDWFRNINTNEKGVMSLVEAGYMLPLPKRDSQGRLVVLFRLANSNPKNSLHTKANEMRAGHVVTTWMCQDEDVQVNGMVYLFDMSGFTVKHFKRWNAEEARKSSKAWQDATPGRVKQFHFYNGGAFFEGIMTLMRPFSKKKFLERYFVHNTLESVYKHIPLELLPEEYLPDEYTGPNAGPIQTVIDNLKNELKKSEFNKKMLEDTGDKYLLNEKKAPAQDVPVQHFRKLNID